MKKPILVFAMIAAFGAAAGCSTEHQSRTTTRETVQTVPADPVVVEKRTSIHTETRTNE